MNWMDMSLSTYQDALASTEPTPGGGTASAIALGQAVGLTHGIEFGRLEMKNGNQDGVLLVLRKRFVPECMSGAVNLPKWTVRPLIG